MPSADQHPRKAADLEQVRDGQRDSQPGSSSNKDTEVVNACSSGAPPETFRDESPETEQIREIEDVQVK